MLLYVDLTDFFASFFDKIFELIGTYFTLLDNIVLFNLGDYRVSCLNLRLGVLFFQIFFGIVFVLAPRLGGGSVMKGNGI